MEARTREILQNVLEMKDIGNSFYKDKLYADAEAAYSGALHCLDEDKTGHPEIRALTLTLLSNRAQSSICQGYYEEALISCDEALTMDPKHPKVLYRRGVAHAKLGHREEVEGCAEMLRTIGCQKEAEELLSLAPAPPEEAVVDCVTVAPGLTSDFQLIKLKKSHTCFKEAIQCPLPGSLGLPFALMLIDDTPGLNPFVTLMMQDPLSRSTPPEWSGRELGVAVLLRKDFKATTVSHANALWDFVHEVLTEKSGEPLDQTRKSVTPSREDFDNFMAQNVRHATLQW